MTVAFGTLLFIGLVNTTLGERMKTERTIDTAQALQLARSGVEYALWEMNYGGNDWDDGLVWTDPLGDGKKVATFPGLGADQNDTLVVEVDQTQTPWRVTSNGTSQSLTRTVGVSVPAPTGGGGLPRYFDHLMYTREGNLYIGGGVTANSYNSSTGGSSSSPTVIRTDAPPQRVTDWRDRTGAGRKNAGALVLDEGAIMTNAQIRMRLPNAGEPSSGYEQPGYALYPWIGSYSKKSGYTDDEDAMFTAHALSTTCEANGSSICGVPASTEPLTYEPKDDGQIPGTMAGMDPLGDPWIDEFNTIKTSGTARICPGESIAPTTVKVTNGTLVLGCANQAECDQDCGGADPEAPIQIYTGYEDGYGDPVMFGYDPITFGDYYWSYPGALGVYGTGQIVVHTPTDIYYNDSSALGLYIGGSGIDNQVLNGAGTPGDPTQLVFYRNECAGCFWTTGYDNEFAASTTFYGAIFDPGARALFTNGAAMDFRGALNVEKVDTGSATVNFYWDEYLDTVFSGAEGGGACTPEDPDNNPCKPQAGSWSFTFGDEPGY